MARAKKEATIILLDVGENTMDVSGKDGSTFFQRAQACASKIIQKKIFAKPTDEVAVLLMGAEDTKNDLNRSIEGFENIVEMIPLQMPTWDMVRALDILEPSDFSSDWVDGLVVALNFHRNETPAKKFTNTRILMITNFKMQTSDENMDVLTSAIRDQQVELLAISDCVEHSDHMKGSQFSQTPGKTSAQASNQRIFSELIQQVGGFMCHLDLAESQLLTFDKKKSRPMPWNATLTIGSHFKINVSAYVSVQKEKFLAPFKVECINPNTVTRMVTEYARNNQPIEKPDVEDVIKAYMYGSTVVALDDDGFKNTEKCFSCLGFSKREFIQKEYLIGEGCHVVLPQKNLEKSAILFTNLVEAMKQGDMVMIARKIYRNNTKPSVVVLYPDFLDKVPFFTMVQLAFSNDIVLFSFPKLKIKKTEPTKEQEKVIEDLVNAMDLMTAVDDDSGLTEAFTVETSLNPIHQHLCRTVAHRALHPTDPLPSMDPELVAMIDVPPKVKKESEEVIKQVEEHFPLEIIERKFKKVFGQLNTDSVDDPMQDDDTNEVDGKNIVAIGTVTPAEDFGYLLKRGERFGTLADQIQTVIYDLIFRTASIQKEKILETIMMYREQAKINGPFSYNNWIKELKNVVIQRNRLDFWQDYIVKEGFGLIASIEAPISTVSKEEQAAFYEVATKDTHHSVSMNQDDEDLDALLDD